MNSSYSTFASHPIIVADRRARLVRTARPMVRSRRVTTTFATNKTNTVATPGNSRYTRFELAEKLNGRMAMVGYLAGSGYELVTGTNYVDQAHTTWPFVVVLAAVLGFATLKTRGLDVVEDKPFTTDLELLNGRLAMLGMLAKFSYDLFGGL
jgi:hypothetical protein